MQKKNKNIKKYNVIKKDHYIVWLSEFDVDHFFLYR